MYTFDNSTNGYTTLNAPIIESGIDMTLNQLAHLGGVCISHLELPLGHKNKDGVVITKMAAFGQMGVGLNL